MNFRAIGAWLLVAAGLFAAIFFLERRKHQPPPGPQKVLPALNPVAVTAVQISLPGQLKIRAERTNTTWQLIEPLKYPADGDKIEKLLGALEQLFPAAYINPHELTGRTKVDEEFGVGTPQATSILIEQPNYSPRLLLGARTVPGNQIFAQIAGMNGIYVIDVDLVNHVPRAANDWRDTTLINLGGLAFDRVVVTRSGFPFELQRGASGSSWSIAPMQARGDNTRIQQLLHDLQSLRIATFVSDNVRVDLETFGLQPPDLQIALAQGTNKSLFLQFGKVATNDPHQVYARRSDQDSIFTISTNLLGPWRAPVKELLDHHLFSTTADVQSIDIRGEENFSISKTNGVWQLTSQNFPADPDLVKELLSNLMGMQVVDFTKDIVTEPDLPAYGLASSAHQYVLKAAAINSISASSNCIIVDLNFGATNQDRVFVRRTDESSVYAVAVADLQRLPSAAFQLRDRHVWNFTEDDVASATIRQNGKSRQIINKGEHLWALGPGSQGFIEPLAIDQTIRGLGQTLVSGWVARGTANRAKYGFSDNALTITLELKKGGKLTLECAGESPVGFPYGGVTLDGDFWIFEMPSLLARDVVKYLTIPAGTP